MMINDDDDDVFESPSNHLPGLLQSGEMDFAMLLARVKKNANPHFCHLYKRKIQELLHGGVHALFDFRETGVDVLLQVVMVWDDGTGIMGKNPCRTCVYGICVYGFARTRCSAQRFSIACTQLFRTVCRFSVGARLSYQGIL